jgi:hypothetical protein
MPQIEALACCETPLVFQLLASAEIICKVYLDEE